MLIANADHQQHGLEILGSIARFRVMGKLKPNF
jgi:hypothetical protein